jgi:hypothetical protein
MGNFALAGVARTAVAADPGYVFSFVDGGRFPVDGKEIEALDQLDQLAESAQN